MHPLLRDPMDVEMDPETQAAVDEVCGALADPWGAASGLGARFRFALYQAAKYGPPDCRRAIFDLVEAGVRNDPDLWMAEGGVCIPRETIARYQGRIVYEHDAEGVMRQVLQWPTGTYVNGEQSYERREQAA